MEEKSDSLVVFDRAVKLPYMNITIYGFLIDQNCCENKEVLTEKIHTYVEYLSALVCWNNEGGTVSEDTRTWYKDGNEYPFSEKGGYFATKYLPESYAKNPINYQIKFGCCPKFEDEDLDESFIIKNIIREQWKR